MTTLTDDAPPRATAGEVDEIEGDVDQQPPDGSETTLDPGNDIGPDQGGAPGDASGQADDPGA